jgi:hypothetical protein
VISRRYLRGGGDVQAEEKSEKERLTEDYRKKARGLREAIRVKESEIPMINSDILMQRVTGIIGGLNKEIEHKWEIVIKKLMPMVLN